MADADFYRGGDSLVAKPGEVVFDTQTDLVLPRRGVSVSTNPAGLERFGGAYRLASLPPDLQAVRIGRRADHYEITPRRPMTFDEYQDLLDAIALVPHSTP